MLILVYAITDLSSTLVPEEIPAKLRCGLCNLVAVNAVKLPCCETSICDKCELMRLTNLEARMLTLRIRPSRTPGTMYHLRAPAAVA